MKIIIKKLQMIRILMMIIMITMMMKKKLIFFNRNISHNYKNQKN